MEVVIGNRVLQTLYRFRVVLALLRSTYSTSSIPVRKVLKDFAHLTSNTKPPMMAVLVFGGDAGNRTRVQKSLLNDSTKGRALLCPRTYSHVAL